MKTPRLFMVLLLTIALPAAIHAEGGHDEKSEETPLGTAMEDMNGAFRKLRRQVADPAQNTSSLELIAKLREGCVEAAKYVPEKIATLPEADQAKAKTSYNQAMQELIKTVDRLSSALKAGQNDEALKIIADLQQQQKAGHKEFRPKKEKKD